MSFNDATILTALAALAVPLVIHLLGRRRARIVTLPTMRFAEGAHIASRGRRWLKGAALLAARLAVIALLVLALAGPYLCDNRAPSVISGARTPANETLAAQGRDPDLTVGARTTTLAPANSPLRVLIVDAAGQEAGRLRSADLVAATFAWGARASTNRAPSDRAPTVRSGLPATSQDLPPSGTTPSLRSGLEPSPSCVTIAQLTRDALAAADVVFWVGPQAPQDATPLAEYLARGGAVVWVPGDTPQPPEPALAAVLGVRPAGVQEVGAGITIDPGGYTSDLVAAFEGGTGGDLGAPVFRRRLTFDSTVAPLAFRDGRAAAVEGRIENGRTLALAAGPGPTWGDLAGRAEFVVLMHSLAEAVGPMRETYRAPTVRSGLAASADKTFATPGRDPELTLGARSSTTPLAPWLALTLVVALALESVLAAYGARRANAAFEPRP